MKHLSQPPDLSRLPPRLAPVIGRALEKDPARRYASVAALAEAFECAVLGRPSVLEIPESAFVASSANGAPVRCRVHRRRHGSGVQGPWRRHCGKGVPFAQSGTWLIAGLIGLLITPIVGGPVIGLLSLLAVGYGAYRSVREYSDSALPGTGASATPSAPVVPLAAPSPPRHQPGEPGTRCRRAQPNPATIRTVSPRERLAGFAEGAAVAAVLTVVFTAGLAATGFFAPAHFVARSGQSFLDAVDPALVGLFAATALFAAWTIMGVSKLLEGRNVDPLLRRFMLLLIGCVIGEVAWGLDEFLFVHLPDRGDGLFTTVNSIPLADPHGPTWLGYILFFGPLLAVRRWWWHADSYRPRRFRLMSLLLTMLCAFLLSTIWQFPQMWAVVWAAVIFSVVQLSSAWTPPQARIAR
jgi:hypothetical protein